MTIDSLIRTSTFLLELNIYICISNFWLVTLSDFRIFKSFPRYKFSIRGESIWSEQRRIVGYRGTVAFIAIFTWLCDVCAAPPRASYRFSVALIIITTYWEACKSNMILWLCNCVAWTGECSRINNLISGSKRQSSHASCLPRPALLQFPDMIVKPPNLIPMSPFKHKIIIACARTEWQSNWLTGENLELQPRRFGDIIEIDSFTWTALG